MNTKNIFRMLLVAVALLMGANNVKADKTLNAYGNNDYYTINASEFTGITENSVLKVYSTYDYLYVATGNWNPLWKTNGDNVEKSSSYYNANGYFEFELTSEILTKISQENGMILKNYNGNTISQVVVTDGSGGGTVTPPAPVAYSISYNISGKGTVTANPGPDSANAGEEVTLTVTPGTGQRLKELIVRDGNYSTITMTDETHFVMPETNVIVYATFEAIQYTITVNSAENGSVSAYRETAPYGEVVTIYPQANHGYKLEQITVTADDGTNITVSSDNKFTMPAQNVTISATFVGAEYNLTWQVRGESEPYLVQRVSNGDPIVEPVAPVKEGYVFAGWDQHDEIMGAGDKTIYGSFYYNINLVYDSTQGQATLSKTHSLGNEEIQLTVVPATGYEVDNVVITDANGNVNYWGSYSFRISASDVTVTVTFRSAAAVTYNVWNDNNTQNGNVWADKQTAEEGATVTLSSQPNTGYELDYYTVTSSNGAVTVNGNQFTMPASNVWYGAVFKQINYTVTVTEPTNGTVTADKTTDVHYGDEVTLTVSPAEGYELDQLTVKDGNNNNVAVNNNKFTMPASNVTVTATFKQQEVVAPTSHSITVSTPSNGTVTASAETATAGTTITLTITPDEGYEISSVTTNPYTTVNYVSEGTYNFTMPDNDVTVNVTFTEIPAEIEYETVSVGTTGYATFSSTNALDFSGVSGLNAFVVTSVDNNYAYLERVTGTVAARTGLILVGSTKQVPIVDSGTSYTSNLLQAVVDRSETISGSGKYVLTTSGTSVRFAEVERNAATVAIGHAYLDLSASGARIQYIDILWDDETTGIDAAKTADEEGESVIYDLRGRRVTNPTKGLYIINGKKVIIK